MSLPYMNVSALLNESANLVSKCAVRKIEQAAKVGAVGVEPSRRDGFDLNLVIVKSFGGKYYSTTDYARGAALKVLNIAHLEEKKHPIEFVQLDGIGYHPKYAARLPLRLEEIGWMAHALAIANFREELNGAEKKLAAARANVKIVDELFAPLVTRGFSEHRIGGVIETKDGYDLILSPPERLYSPSFQKLEKKERDVGELGEREGSIRERFGFVMEGDGRIKFDPQKERIEREYFGFSEYVQAVVLPMDKHWDGIGKIAIRGKVNKERFEEVFWAASAEYDERLGEANRIFKRIMGKSKVVSEIRSRAGHIEFSLGPVKGTSACALKDDLVFYGNQLGRTFGLEEDVYKGETYKLEGDVNWGITRFSVSGSRNVESVKESLIPPRASREDLKMRRGPRAGANFGLGGAGG